ncbi:MAG: hypothetical protein GTN81_16345 [Proteobacteria bacterium]|nr:hypothetical protein [Pseudomonadota bacterium]
MFKDARFVSCGTFEKPGPIGRALRLFLGCLFLYSFTLIVADFRELTGLAIPRHPMIWFGVGLSLYVLGDAINVGFTRSWRRWPQLGFAVVGVGAIVFDLLTYGSFWGPPLGFLIFFLLIYVTGHLGASFILAGILATPG